MHFANIVYLCVPYDSHNRQALFPYTTLPDFITELHNVVCEVRGKSLSTKPLMLVFKKLI
jgi:hypothetical protein